MKISFGTLLTDAAKDNLALITPEDLYNRICTDLKLKSEIEKLRKIRTLDVKTYHLLKLKLPYFVGAEFVPHIRHSDNFIRANYVILDFDNYFQDGIIEIPKTILQNKMVMMGFVSPSGLGFKILINLEKSITNLSDYKLAYLEFARSFAEAVNIKGFVDLKTCDATRACFLSHDKNAYFNPHAESLNLLKYLPINNETALEENNTINPDKLDAVLKKINPQKIIKKNTFEVPDALQNVGNDLQKLCELNDLTFLSATAISYGIKLQIKKGYSVAEVNVFHGKKGFSIVKSPKSGTDPKLTEILFILVENLLFGQELKNEFNLKFSLN